MRIYGNFEGFLLHRGLSWRTPVNSMNVGSMLTMEVVNPLVEKTGVYIYICISL